MKIAITGGMYAGKSTLGRYLEEHYGWHFMDYTGQLKRFLSTALTALHTSLAEEGLDEFAHPVTVTQIGKQKDLFRPLLQNLGTYLEFDDGFYVSQMLRHWQALGAPEPVYFDNVRFPAQFELLKEAGFVLVGLQISRETEAQRAYVLGVTEDELERMKQHKAESGVVPELLLDGECSIAANADLLSRLAGVRVRDGGLQGADTGRAASKRVAVMASR